MKGLKDLTGEQHDQIVERYLAGHRVKAIADDFGTYAGTVSALALSRGCPRRHAIQFRDFAKGGVLKVRLRPQEIDELRKLAKGQQVKPETIAREAIAAYLGMVR